MRRCVLIPCPGCLRVRTADEGHHLCRECEGYPPPAWRGMDSLDDRSMHREGLL